MKNIIMIVIAMTITSLSYGQVEYSDSINKTSATGYVGVLAGPKISTTDSKTSNFITVRFGGTAVWKPSKRISFFGLGIGEANQTGAFTPLSLIGAKISPLKTVLITVGKVVTPMAELRPSPASAGGQFEPRTKGEIPGSALGGKIAINMSKKVALVAGEFWRGAETSTEVGLNIPYTQIAGYYMPKSKMFGVALNFKYKYFSTVVAYNSRKYLGSLDILEIPKTNGLYLYSDIGFEPVKWGVVRGEWGFFKTFSAEKLKALLGAGYNQETKSVKGYVFLHI